MSLYDKDDPQAQVYAERHRRLMEDYDRRRDPLRFYWRRGLRHLAEVSGAKIPLDLSPLGD